MPTVNLYIPNVIAACNKAIERYEEYDDPFYGYDISQLKNIVKVCEVVKSTSETHIDLNFDQVLLMHKELLEV